MLNREKQIFLCKKSQINDERSIEYSIGTEPGRKYSREPEDQKKISFPVINCQGLAEEPTGWRKSKNENVRNF